MLCSTTLKCHSVRTWLTTENQENSHPHKKITRNIDHLRKIYWTTKNHCKQTGRSVPSPDFFRLAAATHAGPS